MYIREAGDGFGILKKSYRNTVEISQFATNVLHHGNFAVYPVEPIIRHGEEPVVRNVRVREDIYRKAALILKKWQEKGLETLAVICRNEHDAGIVATELGRFIEVRGNDLQTAEFGSGVMILPVDYTKGLEFDAVLILDPTRDDYPTDDGHAKLLYVAATRALHELCVLYSGDLTGLIADPISEERIRIIGAEPENAQKKNEVMAHRAVRMERQTIGKRRSASPASLGAGQPGASHRSRNTKAQPRNSERCGNTLQHSSAS